MMRPVLSMLCLTIVTSLVLAEPPKVVRATPDHGDSNVDPGLREIRITFDQDMGLGASWVGGGESFPEVRERPRWVSPRECVLSVSLRPEHLYRISLNGPRHQNFRSQAGESMAPYPLWFRTGPADEQARAKVPRLTTEQNEAAVAALLDGIDQRYSYRDRLGLDWSALIDGARADLVASPSSFTFASRLSRLLAAADDLHISVRADGVSFPAAQRFVQPNFRLDTVLGRLTDVERTPNVLRGRLPGGAGYLLVASWDRSRAEEIEGAIAHVKALAEPSGLIIDVRPNSGGDEMLARRVAGCFVEEPLVYAKHAVRDPQRPSGLTSPAARTLMPHPDVLVSKPVAVLTGPANMSSCEAFLLMMKAAPNAVLIGESSYGSSGNPKPLELPNEVTVMLPSWQAMRPDGSVFEGEGIAPDIRVEANVEVFAETDPVLETAEAWVADALKRTK